MKEEMGGRKQKKSQHLCIGGGGVGNEGARRAAILAKPSDQLGGVAIKVMGHISETDLTAVQVLECHIHCLHGCLKRLPVCLTASAWPVVRQNSTSASV